MRTRVKMCGFTRQEDAQFAASLGVDAIGLVFYPSSPRHVEIEQAAMIVKNLPAFVNVVALFVDADPAYINAVLQQVRVDSLQFHGDEPVEHCRLYRKPYIKALAMRDGLDLREMEKRYQDASGLLLDAYQIGVPGGSGIRFDWDLIPARRSLPLILAGGLTPENAGQAIKAVKPYALDVSSGVEAGKGVKDAEKMAAFIKTTNQLINIL